MPFGSVRGDNGRVKIISRPDCRWLCVAVYLIRGSRSPCSLAHTPCLLLFDLQMAKPDILADEASSIVSKINGGK